jgi:hypothetical protein
MAQGFELPDSDRAKVENEISSLENKVLQIIIPSMLSIGLVSIVGSQHYGKVAMAGTCAIIMSSGTSVATLSYKKFKTLVFYEYS